MVFVPLVFGVLMYIVVTDGPSFKLVVVSLIVPIAVVVRAFEVWRARRNQ